MESDGAVLFRVWTGFNVRNLWAAPGSVVAGQRYHLVGTYDGANMRIYRNGTRIASGALTGSLTNSGDSLRIGRNDFNSTHFDGTIDEAAVYSTLLSTATISSHYAAGG